MPVYVDPKGGNELQKRALAVMNNLPVDKEANAGRFIAIEVLAQDFEIADDELTAKRMLMRKGYPEETIAVMPIKGL